MRPIHKISDRLSFEIAIDGKTLNTEEFLDHYLNTLENHREPERREIIDNITAHFPAGEQKVIITLLL